MSDFLADISDKIEQYRSERLDGLAIILRANPGVWFEFGDLQTRGERDGDKYHLHVSWPVRWFRNGVEIDPRDLAWPL